MHVLRMREGRLHSDAFDLTLSSYLCRAISPLCITVPLLEAGLQEGRDMVARTFAPASLAAAQPMSAVAHAA
jgi:hypothetical protein